MLTAQNLQSSGKVNQPYCYSFGVLHTTLYMGLLGGIEPRFSALSFRGNLVLKKYLQSVIREVISMLGHHEALSGGFVGGVSNRVLRKKNVTGGRGGGGALL